MTTAVSAAAISRRDQVGGSMTESQIVELFMRDEISAEDLVGRLSQLNRAPAAPVQQLNAPISVSLVRAQAAIRRISGK